MRWVGHVCLVVAAWCSGCGGGGSGPDEFAESASTSTSTPILIPPPTPTAASSANDSLNVVPLVVGAGTGRGRTYNRARISITLCLPGSTRDTASGCQRIDHILVDTGSTGLRVNRRAIDSALFAKLAPVRTGRGDYVSECRRFATTYSWGALRAADVRIGGELAPNLAFQLIDDAGVVPAECSGASAGNDTPLSDLARLTADEDSSNGIIGIGSLVTDSGWFYGCPAPGCAVSATHVAQLDGTIRQPVSAFARDNNGIVITLPNVPDGRAAEVVGTLTFGIGTQADNALDKEDIFKADALGYLGETTIDGRPVGRSMLDTGVAFNWSSETGMPLCADGAYLCPAFEQIRSGTLLDSNRRVVPFTFGIRNATEQFAVPGLNAYASIGRARPAPSDAHGSSYAYFGMPFFYGRRVFIALSGTSARTRSGISVSGPFNAFVADSH